MDTGVGIYSLPAYLEYAQLRQEPTKPLDVVLTHAHFDHSGGAHQYKQVSVCILDTFRSINRITTEREKKLSTFRGLSAPLIRKI